MKTFRSCNLLVLVLILLNEIVLAQPGSYYPPPSSINYQTDTLIIYPPDSLPGDPVILLGYNIYVDEDFYGNIMISDPEESVCYFLDDESLMPGSRIFCVDAVYNQWISEGACDTAFIAYGYELPFNEDWSSGSFETLQWTKDSDHWVIDSDDGDPSPSVSFQGEPGLTNYEASLESYPINAIGMINGIIWMDFDLKLDALQSTNTEKLLIQVWSSTSQTWITMAEFLNGDGSFSWDWKHVNIKYPAMDKVFKIKFLASGVNSVDILSWKLDNIHIYRKCEGIYDLEIEEYPDFNKLSWYGPDGCTPDEWIHWDDGYNSGNSIGTGTAVEFIVAARWTPAQLTYFHDALIDKVRFFPAEWQAAYNIRIWSGEGPDTLLLDQPVNSPVIGAWNTVEIDPPLMLDNTKELWVGYNINAETGYPAGVDDGPAINGYGNMMYYDSAWQTMLEINNELDYNWNIACHVGPSPEYEKWDCKIYRNKNDEGFQFLDTSAVFGEYIDTNIVISDHYCYHVTWVWMENGDTCESDPSEACEYLWFGVEEPIAETALRIYPNPASSLLNIESPDKISEVRLYDMLGECELKLEIGNLEGRVDVSRLGNGIYFLQVFTKDRSYSSKILITR